MDIREYLKKRPLLFDGAMGTYSAERYPDTAAEPCETLCLTAPERVADIHRAYLAAGAGAIKTNTFAANRVTLGAERARAILNAAFRIACETARDAFVFADIGPIPETGQADTDAEYRFVADIFLAAGARHFLFETNSSPEAVSRAAAYIKRRVPEAFILVSFAVLPDGFSRAGVKGAQLLLAAEAEAAIDAVGVNCASGARHMAKFIEGLSLSGDKPLSVMPNAGYPTVLGNRTYYNGTPSYFGDQVAYMASLGATILGGCCGTTPAHIEAAARALRKAPAAKARAEQGPISLRPAARTRFTEALSDPAARPFAVELDPPEGADIARFMAGAAELVAGGASAITVADCPIGRARMDASLLACRVKRELGVDVLPHMTCRDRNLNATKALLLGLSAEDVHSVLIVTGDPIPSACRDEVKSVYNFNSRMLASFITSLGESVLPTPFSVFGALNVNARNFDVQLAIAREKEQNGVCGFFTQPILTEAAVTNLRRAREVLSGHILGGIFPLVSYKNACFMHSEVAGVQVDERILSLYEGASREEAEEIAVRVSVAVARQIRDTVDGYYLMTPFSRTALVSRIMDAIRADL